ncbi:MAG: MBL fold metallo-hydrolase [Muribaculaceae bacterium]|nr:MBL fold metallo-hydrolase [Muribaculaceae bacterium]
MFELTYIHHDCFLLMTPECSLVFDFWKDPESRGASLPAFLRTIPGDRPLYVFVSHFHKDHFNKEIFSWVGLHPDIRFVISKDVERHARYILRSDSLYRGDKPDSSLVTVMSKMDSFDDGMIHIDAFGSTDIGNSYAVTLKRSGLKVFHAGDLNCWAWRDESSPEEISQAESAFRNELRPIAAAYPEFDIAMFPVDSRIGTGYASGASEFVRLISVKRFFPMHFALGDTPQEIERHRRDAMDFSVYAAPEGEYIALTAPGDSYKSEAEGESRSNEMKNVYSRRYFLSAGETDAERELSLPTLTAKLIEIATEHANAMGIGNPDMPGCHCGWVLSRLTIEMHSYPKVDSDYTISTWIESCNRHFSERSFAISDGEGNEVGYARSVWMVLDTISHANAGLDGLNISDDMIDGRECPIPRQGKHFTILTPEEAKSATGKFLVADRDVRHHTFRFSDLDAYRHVNTIRYVALLMDCYSLKEHDAMRIGRLELSFLHEGGYGRELDILQTTLPSSASTGESAVDAIQLRDAADRSPVIFAKVRREPRNDEICGY